MFSFFNKQEGSKKQNKQKSLNRPNKPNQLAKDLKINLSISTPKYKTILKLFSSFLFLFLLSIALFLNGCNALNPKTGALEGEVHGQTPFSTTPLADALISISGSTNTTYTDQDGYFLLTDVPAGKRALSIIKEGYITLKLLNVYIEPDIVNQVFFGQTIILQPKEDTALYNTAIEYMEQKDYQSAYDTFLELRNTFPDSIWADDAQYYIGYIYEITGSYILANNHYSSLLVYYPDSPWADNARLGMGNCYYMTDDYFHAKIHYQLVIDNYPFSDLIPFAQYRIAWCDKSLGNFEEAIQDFLQVITLYPQSVHTPPSQYFIGEIYYSNLQNYNEAYNAFQDTISNYPLAAWPDEKRLIAPAAHFYIGKCYEKQKRWQEAIDNYQIIIAQYPDSTWGNGDSIADEAQERIDDIREHHLPPE